MAGQTLSFAQRYNPLRYQSDTRTWNDSNGDNVAQESEIGPSQQRALRAAGLHAPSGRGHRAASTTGSTAPAIQHELMRNLSVIAAWYHRNIYNMMQSINGPFSARDYNVVNVVSPLDGSIIPAYNLDRGQARAHRSGR